MNKTPERLTVVALVTSVPFAVLGALELVHDQAEVFAVPMDYAVEIAFTAAMAAAAAAYVVLAAGANGLVRLAWWASSAGSASVAVAAGSTVAAGRETLGALIGIGLLAVLVSLVAAAVMDLRGRVAPRRAAVALLVALIGSVVVEATGAGGVVLALGWFGVSRLAAARPGLVDTEPVGERPASAWRES